MFESYAETALAREFSQSTLSAASDMKEKHKKVGAPSERAAHAESHRKKNNSVEKNHRGFVMSSKRLDKIPNYAGVSNSGMGGLPGPGPLHGPLHHQWPTQAIF